MEDLLKDFSRLLLPVYAAAHNVVTCVQGVVNLVRSSPDAGGNVVVAGSHKQYASLNQQFFSKSGQQRITAEIAQARPEIFTGTDVAVWVDCNVTFHLRTVELWFW